MTTHELGARYEYMLSQGAANAFPRALRNMVAKLHSVVCHPSNECFSHMLLHPGFGKEAFEAAKALRCEIGIRVSAPRAMPKVVPRRAERFNEAVGSDTCYVFPGGANRPRQGR